MDLSHLTQLMWSEDFFFRFAPQPLVTLVGSRNGAWLRRFDLAVAPRFLWVGIELGRANLQGGGLPSSPFRSARRGHSSTKAAFPEAPL